MQKHNSSTPGKLDSHLQVALPGLVKNVVQAPEDGLAEVAWAGLQAVLWVHSCGPGSQHCEAVCNCLIHELAHQLQAIRVCTNSAERSAL